MSFDPYAQSAKNAAGSTNNFRLFKFPDTVKFTKLAKAGDYAFDFLTHDIKGKNHPAIKDGASLGDSVYIYDYWRHMNVGPQKLAVICPAKTLGKKCPICEAAETAAQEFGYKSKEFSNLKPKHRGIYNVALPDSDEVTLLDESYPLFEQELIKASGNKARRKGKAFIKFAELEEGWTVQFTAEKKKLDGYEFNEYSTFDFEHRDEPRNPSILKKTTSPDEFMTVYSYEELTALLNGEDVAAETPPAEERQETKPKAKEAEEAQQAGPKCPAGKRYGKDWDIDDPKCDDCDLFRECRKQTKAS